MDNRFDYFNPCVFFEKNPEGEKTLYRFDAGKDKKDLADIFAGKEPIPGLELLENYCRSESSTSYARFVSDALFDEERKEGLKHQPFKEEEEFLTKLQSEITAYIEKKEPELDKNNPYLDLPYTTDVDSMSEWNSQKEKFVSGKQEIADFREYIKDPYYYKFAFEKLPTAYVGNNAIPSLEPVDSWCDAEFVSRLSEIGRMTASNGKTYEGDNILLRRRIQIIDGKLIKVQDVYQAGAQDLGEAPDVTDPFLLNVFYRRRGDTNIRSIVSTIQDEQKKVLEADPDHNVFVNGCAGSGKTMILLQRMAQISYLKPNVGQSRFVIISPNENFATYLAPLLSSLNETKMKLRTMASYLVDRWCRYREQFRNDAVDAAGKDSVGKAEDILRYYNTRVAWTCLDSDADPKLVDFIYSSGLKLAIKTAVTQRQLKRVRLGFFRGSKYLFDDFDQDVDDFLEVLGEASGLKIPYSSRRTANVSIPTCLAYAIVSFLKERHGTLITQDRYIAIDEAQDYNKAIFKLLVDIQPDAVFNIYYDHKQDLGRHGDSWSEKGLRVFLKEADSFVLRENYRNSAEIGQYCRDNLGADDTCLGVSTMAPQVIEPKRLVALLTFHSVMKDRIAIVYHPSLKNLVKNDLEPTLKRLKINASLLIPLEAKGMEFDDVFVLGGFKMTHEQKYVSCTRALSELYFVQSENKEAR